MAPQSPKVARTLARYLVALVAQLEAERGQLSDADRAVRAQGFDRALEGLTGEERAELEVLASSIAASLAVSSLASAPSA
jgi:hypothetical protein